MSIIARIAAELRRFARRVGIIADEAAAKEAASEPSQEPPAPVAGEGEERKRNRALDEPEAATGGGASPRVEFRWGGVKANPTEDALCRVSGLRIGNGSLSFRWDAGIPRDWRRQDAGKGPMVLACAFVWSGDRWVGGKFDWIDEARSSRPLANIYEGYNGWDARAWATAKRRAFCVASADGKFRSNLAEAAA